MDAIGNGPGGTERIALQLSSLPRALREQVYEIVLLAILNGDFKPGSSRPCCPE